MERISDVELVTAELLLAGWAIVGLVWAAKKGRALMNPLYTTMLYALLRMVMLLTFGSLIEKGIWTTGQVDQLAIGATGLVLTVIWALWNHYKTRLKFLTALELPAGADEQKVDAKIASGAGAKVLGLFLAVVLTLPGCAWLKSPNVEPATKVDVVLFEALASIQDAEIAARHLPVTPPVISAADHKAASRLITDAFRGLAAYNDALDLGDAKTATEKLRIVKRTLDDLKPLLARAIKDPATLAKINAGLDLAFNILAPILGR